MAWKSRVMKPLAAEVSRGTKHSATGLCFRVLSYKLLSTCCSRRRGGRAVSRTRALVDQAFQLLQDFLYRQVRLASSTPRIRRLPYLPRPMWWCTCTVTSTRSFSGHLLFLHCKWKGVYMRLDKAFHPGFGPRTPVRISTAKAAPD